MKKLIYFPFIVLLLMNVPLNAQRNQKNKSLILKFSKTRQIDFTKTYRAVRLPIILFAAADFYREDNQQIYDQRKLRLPHFKTRVDDYLQYAPIAAVYSLDAAGFKAKHHFAKRTSLLIKSELIVSLLTFSMKRIWATPRPDTGSPTSFPSGHTAQAFASATFFVKEYGNHGIGYSVAAYGLATSIGTLRILNNRHWLSDVMAGAAVGILSTQLAYLLPHRFAKKRKLIAYPYYSDAIGLNINYTF